MLLCFKNLAWGISENGSVLQESPEDISVSGNQENSTVKQQH
jgi:hypothetical protein